MLNSSAVAQQIARGLALSGVTEVVIAPGSRSAPLIYALAPLAEAGVIRMHVRIDERDAGFLALGLARGLRAKQSAG
ncbi:MAG: 2-succinyl-5-enolpyruvyl-6-hydroxy-3-cyclohexene-1-carboxylic-acid synthase, partial [Brevibacterium sp.]|nr:2-succinyl-5-enolpyruvyl-6-hydroxy-3-cyclohexene-1-carboxylic-acid synthase [Brevibacterium sp.]